MWEQATYAWSNWETASYPQACDLHFILPSSLLFLALRLVLDSVVFERIGRYYIFKQYRYLYGVHNASSKHNAQNGSNDVGGISSRNSSSSSSSGSSSSGGEGDGCSSPASRTSSMGSNVGESICAEETFSQSTDHPVIGADGCKCKDPAAAAAAAPAAAAAAAAAAATSEVVRGELEALEKVHVKFKESCWKAVYYSSAALFAASILFSEPWLQNSELNWIGEDGKMWPDQPMKLKVKALTVFYGGFYTYSIFALLFWETRRKDFGVVMMHHVLTVAIVVSLFLCRIGPVSVVAVAVHDISDVFLELAKICKYVNMEMAANVLFVVFATSWVVFRLWCFPRYVILRTMCEMPTYLQEAGDGVHGTAIFYVINCLWMTFLVFHVYWWVLIARVMWKQVTSGAVEDVRSDDEE